MFKLRFLLFSVLLTGCTSGPKYTSPSSDEGNLATVHFYRTDVSFHSLNPEKPFFYIDGKQVATLGTGQSVSTKVTSGTHLITVREPVAFMPAWESGRIEHVFEAGEQYYIRYSKNFDGAIPVGNQVVVTGKTSVTFSNQEMYINRQ